MSVPCQCTVDLCLAGFRIVVETFIGCHFGPPVLSSSARRLAGVSQYALYRQLHGPPIIVSRKTHCQNPEVFSDAFPQFHPAGGKTSCPKTRVECRSPMVAFERRNRGRLMAVDNRLAGVGGVLPVSSPASVPCMGASPQTNPLRIGLFGIGLDVYWPQFSGTEGSLGGLSTARSGQVAGSRGRSGQPRADRYAPQGRRSGTSISAGRRGLDLPACHHLCPVVDRLPVVRRAKVPVIVLNLSPDAGH